MESRSPSRAPRRAEPCPRCGAALGTPLVCESCRALLDPAPAPTPFEVFGLAPAFALAPGALHGRLLELSRLVHPDYFGASTSAERQRAERNTAALNAAFQVLSDDARRADQLVSQLQGPRESEERSLPAAFLQEVLEWNEAIEEARAAEPGSRERAGLTALGARLAAERARLLGQAAGLLAPLPEPGARVLGDVRRILNAIRYLDRARREIAELALLDASRAR